MWPAKPLSDSPSSFDNVRTCLVTRVAVVYGVVCLVEQFVLPRFPCLALVVVLGISNQTFGGPRKLRRMPTSLHLVLPQNYSRLLGSSATSMAFLSTFPLH